ncbi:MULTISPECIES: hypothetical protein [unclassified Allomuricauda]|nr:MULTISPECIES: hypothetical protein [unclassified Allomuricauda]
MFKIIVILFISILFLSCSANKSVSYFDQKPPSTIPKLFAPSIVNTDSIELNVVFNHSHTELFFSRIVNNSFVIHHSERIEGKWSPIKPIKMYPDDVLVSVACDPTITKDGNTMYFLGVDPNLYNNDITKEALYRIPPDIYSSKKVNGKWQLAQKVDFTVSTEFFETYPVVTADGSLYFRSNRPSEKEGLNTFRAQYIGNNKFEAPKMIPPVTENGELIVYVSPDESYAVTNAKGRFQITFNENDKWSKPKEIPLEYEEDWKYYCPYMSSDGKYFMYSRRKSYPQKKGWAGVEKGEVFWISAKKLFDLK